MCRACANSQTTPNYFKYMLDTGSPPAEYDTHELNKDSHTSDFCRRKTLEHSLHF